jgi:hypothetical protein
MTSDDGRGIPGTYADTPGHPVAFDLDAGRSWWRSRWLSATVTW